MFIHFLPNVKNIFRIYVFITHDSITAHTSFGFRYLRAESHFNVSRKVWINLNLTEFNIEKKIEKSEET